MTSRISAGAVSDALRRLEAAGKDGESALQHVVVGARVLVQGDAAWCAVAQDRVDASSLGIVAHVGLHDPRTASAWRLGLGEGIGGGVAATGTAALIRDYRHDPRRRSQVKSVVDAEGMRSGVVTPLRIEADDRSAPGVLYVGDRVPHAYGPAEVDLLDAYATAAGQVVSRRREQARVQAAQRQAEHEASVIGLVGSRLAAGDLDGGLQVLADFLDAFVEVRDRHGHPLATAGVASASTVTEVPLRTAASVLGSLRIHGAGPVGLRSASMSTVALLMTLHLLRSRERYRTEMRLHTDLLDDVLEHRGDPRRLLDRAALLGLDLATPRAVVCIGAHTGTVVEGTRAPTLTLPVLEAVRRALDPMGAQTVVTLHDGDAVVLAPAAHDLHATPGGLAGRMGEVLTQVSSRVGGMRLAAGLGRRCTSVADYARSYQDAMLALNLARGGADGGTVVCHDQLI